MACGRDHDEFIDLSSTTSHRFDAFSIFSLASGLAFGSLSQDKMSFFTKSVAAALCLLASQSTLVLSAATRRAPVQPLPHVARGVGASHSFTGPYGANGSYGTNDSYIPPQDGSCSYWLEDIAHQGVAPFQNDPSYKIFRNVKDYGAVGDGITDDTAAINLAISSGDRCAPGSCNSSTTTPAVVYFPAGTYLISDDIIDYYYTSLIGNPNCLPTLKVAASYNGSFIIDGDPYGANGLSYGATNVFWREIRNFILDTTSVPASFQAVGIHWPTGQATSVGNVLFRLNEQPGTKHWGLFIEQGSGGFLSDLTFIGGLYGANVGNQQFTSRNWTFYNCVTAINQLWDWGWTYQDISFNNVTVGVNMSSGGEQNQAVGSIVLFDSEFNNVQTGIIHAHTQDSLPPGAGALILENVDFTNVGVAIQGPDGVNVPGSSGTFNIPAWAQGHAYYSSSTNFTDLDGYITPNQRSPALTSQGKYYYRRKPQYGDWPVSQIVSARSMGAAGDGVTDDTVALQDAIYAAHSANKILFIDGGDYIVTSTLYIPGGSKIFGELFPVILATGSYWSDISNPLPVVQVGKTGEVGQVEFSNVIMSTRGPNPGAVLIQWNLASANAPQSSTPPEGYAPQGGYYPGEPESLGPSGIWDVHTRIGGFTGSDLQIGDCPAAGTQNVSIPPGQINPNCVAAATSMHVTSSARNLYMENNWLWVADHDADDGQLRQLTIYAGRGLLIESNYGVWLVGTAVEHHTLYQYQFANTQDAFMGHIQTETAYYQPNPPAQIPFPVIASLNDPTFPDHCLNGSSFLSPDTILQPNQLSNDCDGWGLRIVDSFDMYVYGAGHYSFFYNYNVTCSQAGYGAECQQHIVSLEGSTQNVDIYGLSTVGSQFMITYDGQNIVPAADNVAGFTDTIALFRPYQS